MRKIDILRKHQASDGAAKSHLYRKMPKRQK